MHLFFSDIRRADNLPLSASYIKTQGFQYLRSNIGVLVDSVCKKPSEVKLEANGIETDEAANKNVEALGEAFLDVISSTWTSLPICIRRLCTHLHKVVELKWPGSGRTAVGGLIFLRFSQFDL